MSSKFDPFLDLSLEVNKAVSVRRALAFFTVKEILDGSNKYRCPKNNKLVRAEKQVRGALRETDVRMSDERHTPPDPNRFSFSRSRLKPLSRSSSSPVTPPSLPV